MNLKLMTKWIISATVGLLLATACGRKTEPSTQGEATAPTGATATAPDFDADSALAYVARQVDFGPRVPGTEAHRACATYLADELRRHGATVTVQEAEVTTYDGRRLTAKNIIGASPNARKAGCGVCDRGPARR